MKAAGEAVVHAVVVGPVFLLAGLIEATAKVCLTAAAFVGLFAGDQQPRHAGVGEVETA